MRGLRETEFYVVYLCDDDEMTFNVIGPVYEGDDIDDRTCALIDRGRNVHVCVSEPENDPFGFHPENYIGQGPEDFKFDPYLKW